ncbi:unnamed protein product [Lathyrus sativus]|nr:unnamed protein product [Lathyrus sativus]
MLPLPAIASHHPYSPAALHSQVSITIDFDKTVMGFFPLRISCMRYFVNPCYADFQIVDSWLKLHLDSMLDYEFSDTSLGRGIDRGFLDWYGPRGFGLRNGGFIASHDDLTLGPVLLVQKEKIPLSQRMWGTGPRKGSGPEMPV